MPINNFSHDHLEQLSHQLVALEVALQDEYRQSTLSVQDYRQRYELVQGLQAELKKIQVCKQLGNSQAAAETDLGLPRLDGCTPDEKEVCQQFLDERLRLAEHLCQQTQTVTKWLEEAVRGKGGWLATTLRLSKLRKKLGQLNYWHGELEDEDQRLSQMMHRLVASIRNRNQRDDVISNLKGLINIFYDLNRITGRVAKLKEAVQIENEAVAQMETWLREREAELSRSKAHARAPGMKAIDKWDDRAREFSYKPIAVISDRLNLAKEFIQQCIEPAPEKKGGTGAYGPSSFDDEPSEIDLEPALLDFEIHQLEFAPEDPHEA